MNQKSDPTCSHDFKSSTDQKQSLDYDKNVPSKTVASDKQIVEADDSISNHLATLPEYCKDVAPIIFVSDKLRVEHQTCDEIGHNKIQELDEDVSSMTNGLNRQVIDHVADDTKRHQAHLNEYNKDLHAIVRELDKQIVDSHNIESRSIRQEHLMENSNDGPIIKELKSNNDITESTKLDNNRIGHQSTLEEYIKDDLVIEVIDKKVEPQIDKKYNKDVPQTIDLSEEKNVESPIKDDIRNDRQAMVLYYNPELVQDCNKVVLSVIKILDKQIAEPKIDANKTEVFNENIPSVLDELDNKIFEPRPNDKRSGHQNIVIPENKVETLTPKAFKLAPTLSNMKMLKAHQKRPTVAQLQILSNLPSPMSINIVPSQPQSLFLQALSKLNESSISFAVNSLSKRPDSSLSRAIFLPNRPKSPELTPPASLGSAPPSYSFVLRQMAVRRRPRMFGAFVPSPSFIQHTPPPTYTASFDIYLDNLPPPPTRVYNFGFAPMLVVCPDCGFTGMTQITSKITLCTHLCAFTLCIMCCWVCVPLPYVMRSCKDVYHYCQNCRSFLGTYCPTNPDNVTVR